MFYNCLLFCSQGCVATRGVRLLQGGVVKGVKDCGERWSGEGVCVMNGV